MRRMLLLLFLILMLSLLLVGCDVPTATSKAPETSTTPQTPPETTAPPSDSSYRITFIVNGEETVIIVPHGEMPTFSGATDKAMTASTVYTFSGWYPALAPATEDRIYVACYDRETRLYPVHFSVNGTIVQTVTVPYSASVEPPEMESYEGTTIHFWTNTASIKGETVCEAICFDSTYDDEMLKMAYLADPMKYQGTYENGGEPTHTSSSAMLYLMMAEHDDPDAGMIRDRALEHLRSVITGGQEPGFNAGPFWSYAAVSMAIAVARYTPTVWDELTADEKDRLTLLMECYAILTCFVSDDGNSYTTGPALTGNFSKTWNPNHRMAMILPIVASTAFFSADGRDGAAHVNTILLGFDYDSYIARFQEYGFTRIIHNWTAEGITLASGRKAPSAKELMMNGGTAYISREDQGTTSNGIALGSQAGIGVGVRTVYTYLGSGLDNLPSIVNRLYSYNYSGGAVLSDSSSITGGVSIATGKPLAYIADGTRSPYEGMDGMMLEFFGSDAGGMRSSNSYCTHDFALVVESLAALTAIGAYEINTDSALFRRMWVGNEDLIYKNEHGYNSYSIGKDHGTSNDLSYPYYRPWKAYWIAHYRDAYSID